MSQASFDSVVIISPFYWNFRDDLWQTTHYIAKEFANYLPVLFIEPAIEWNPRGPRFRIQRIWQNCFPTTAEALLPNLTVFRRRGLPFGRYTPMSDFNVRCNAKILGAVLKRLPFKRILLWHSSPYGSEPLIDAIDHSVFVYHCLDYCTLAEEERLMKRADVVCCVSEELVKKHRCHNPRTYLLANGVDLTLFNIERLAKSAKPNDLPKNRRLLGFVGTISYNLDLQLVVNVARAFPAEWVILVGPVLKGSAGPVGFQNDALRVLRSLPNVRILGFKALYNLPDYINAFDVCLMPFLGLPRIKECDPLKFYQYLAMGKPVVTTPVPAAKEHPELCYIAETPDQFIGGISAALSECTVNSVSGARIALAQTHSWKLLVDRAINLFSRTGGQGECEISNRDERSRVVFTDDSQELAHR